MMKWSEKLEGSINLERELEGESTESKITKFGSIFKKKWRANQREISEQEDHAKNEIKIEID